MLKIRYSDDRKPPFWAMEKTFSIGRAQSNHLCIDDDSVGETHARIFNRGETFLLKDAGSESGTFVNGTRITQRNIGCGDHIQIGSVDFEIVDPLIEDNLSTKWALIANSSWLSGQEFPLQLDSEQAKVTLGRSSQCDIVIPGTHLSRKHAEISMQGDELIIRDLNSANGTFVNNQKISVSRLHAGDQIRIDVYSFKVFGPGISLPRAATQTLKAITPDMLEERAPEEKLWKTRATSPGNRTQENLYKKNWGPFIFAATLLCLFIGGTAYYLLKG